MKKTIQILLLILLLLSLGVALLAQHIAAFDAFDTGDYYLYIIILAAFLVQLLLLFLGRKNAYAAAIYNITFPVYLLASLLDAVLAITFMLSSSSWGPMAICAVCNILSVLFCYRYHE